MSELIEKAKKAREASYSMALLNREQKDRALTAIADALNAGKDKIFEANAEDLKKAADDTENNCNIAVVDLRNAAQIDHGGDYLANRNTENKSVEFRCGNPAVDRPLRTVISVLRAFYLHVTITPFVITLL